MPTSSGATPPPPPSWPAAPVKGENTPPKGGARGATGSRGAPSEGACCVPLEASVEGVPAEPPERVLKTSAVALATLVAACTALAAAFWTVPTVLRGRRRRRRRRPVCCWCLL